MAHLPDLDQNMTQAQPISRKMSELDIQTAFDRLADEAVAEFSETGAVRSKAIVIALGTEGELTLYNKVPQTVGQYLFSNIPGVPSIPQYAAEFIADGSELRAQLASEGHPSADIFAVMREVFMTFPAPGTKLRDLPSPSQAPDRTEAVVIEMHTREGVINGYCWIADNPRRCMKGRVQFDGMEVIDLLLPNGQTVRAIGSV
jgi:hypothetical protein